MYLHIIFHFMIFMKAGIILILLDDHKAESGISFCFFSSQKLCGRRQVWPLERKIAQGTPGSVGLTEETQEHEEVGLGPCWENVEEGKGGRVRRAGARAKFRAEVKGGLSPASQGQEYKNLRTVQIGQLWTRLSLLQGRGSGTKGQCREVTQLKWAAPKLLDHKFEGPQGSHQSEVGRAWF